MDKILVSKLEEDQLEEISSLFDLYRVFYGQSSDIDRARSFMKDRIKNQDSIVLSAECDGKLVGFTQLYPSFSSVSTGPILVLNDLYVLESARRRGVAETLMRAAEKYARGEGALRLVLATQKTNVSAQKLYEKLGYSIEEEFINLELELGA